MNNSSKLSCASDRSDIDNLVKKCVLSGITDQLYQMRSFYVSGDSEKAEWMFSNLAAALKEYQEEIGKENSVF